MGGSALMAERTTMDRRLRVSGGLVTLGLLTQLISLHWSHPTAFLVFAFVGVPLVLAGVVVFLYSLVSVRAPQP